MCRAWADPVNEQICRIGHEGQYWLVAADEDRCKWRRQWPRAFRVIGRGLPCE